MLEGYGMTETGPMITFTRPGRRRLGSPGEVLPGTEMQIRDGEIVVRGDHVMQGYFKRPEETAAVIRDGWLHTGDLGRIDADGFLFVEGRKKEILVLSNGKNVNPVEIEFNLVGRSNLIAEVGVYEVRDQLYAVIHPDFKQLETEAVHQLEQHFQGVIEAYNGTVSSYKRIVKFNISKEELPKTRLGKIRRFMLKEVVDSRKKDEAALAKEAEPDDQTYLLIKSFLVRQTDGEVKPSDHIEIDLGLDSLDKVNFHSYLENTFGLELDESVFSKHATLQSLAAYVGQHKKRMVEEGMNWSNILRQKIDLELPRTWITQIWIKYFCRIAFKVYFRFRGEGRNNIPNGPCILAPNHQSFFDGFFIQAMLKNLHLRNTYFYAKEKYWRQSWLKFLAPRHNIILMDVNKDLKLSLQKMAAALQSGKNIIIFPEGTRTHDGKLGKFKKTFAILAHELNVPVVPVSIRGAFEALPRGKWFPKPGKEVTVTFSKPIYPENHTCDSLQEAVFHDLQQSVESPHQPAA
jgi:long-chain acyl-CoA synthetase